MNQGFYQDIEKLLQEKQLTAQELAKEKIKLCRKHNIKEIPSDIQIRLETNSKHLQSTKPTRTISGVAVIAIMTKPLPCPHGKCRYCPGGPGSAFGDVPQSYTGREPATLRGIRNHYDAYLQVMNRLEQYTVLGHPQDKVELIIMGGTFPSVSKEYQEQFVKDALRAMNDFSLLFFDTDGNFKENKFKAFFELPGDIHDPERVKRIHEKLFEMKLKSSEKEKSLKEIQEENETAVIRCVGMTVETRPDYGLKEHGNFLLSLGCTRIEIGIQSIYDDVLSHIKRGHTNADSIQSIQELKDLGFKITLHYMPGLPLTSKEQDIEGMKSLFQNSDYRPDMLKIYPCMVAPGTPLYEDFQQGLFKPITTEEAMERIIELKKVIPTYCRIQRIQRDVPTKQWSAGVTDTNLRQLMHLRYTVACRCIRCREPRKREINHESMKVNIYEYEASEGKEFFIAAEDIKKDIIAGFCRLRLPSKCLRDEITSDSALIRELHVFGSAVGIGKKSEDIQHQGLGKLLLKKAEDIACEHKKKKIVIIAGIGVKEYYKKQDYLKQGPYMVKDIK